jgi:hypothetical protein
MMRRLGWLNEVLRKRSWDASKPEGCDPDCAHYTYAQNTYPLNRPLGYKKCEQTMHSVGMTDVDKIFCSWKTKFLAKPHRSS